MKITLKNLALVSSFIFALMVRKFISTLGIFCIPHGVMVTPLLGTFFSAQTATGLFASYYLAKFVFGVVPVTIGIPTALSLLSWSVNTERVDSLMTRITDACIHVLIPLLCMTLFLVHPVGHNAPIYTLYWLIPVLLWFLKYTQKNDFLISRALQGTFLAHAAGSIMWLYTVPTTSTYWTSLIPVVAIERLVMAAATVSAYYAVMKLNTIIVTALGKLFVAKPSLKSNT